MSVRSMTGYGTGHAAVAGGQVVVELRTLNHRYLDVRVRASRELLEHAGWLEQQVRERVTRGRVEVSAMLEGASLGLPTLDRVRARAAWNAISELRDELAPGAPVPLELLGAVPDLFVPASTIPSTDVRESVASALALSFVSLDSMREREGDALGRELSSRIGQIRQHVGTLRDRSGGVVEAYRAKLRLRIQRMLDLHDLPVDGARLEHEIALFADRCDVTEELTRLESHGDQFEEIQSAGGSVGRRLDFLLQEMYREANTIGSKCCDATIAQQVVAMKADLERMREQIQNVE